ncbi:unnamed protein product [Candidula unifasciata]|uniref:RNA polymerase II subunit B1 CTD phosphatase RPAP2 homolog n=1 Tax=Candidula unifasciata TaxID=100452 RepID=A0A8S3YYG0_9EUPU|nr:unnamed protein product [Candidula unifasciata]
MTKNMENLKKFETTVRSRVECEERAFHIVNNLIDGKVDGPYLIKCGQMISREHYTDVVEERAISYLCGYPLCDNALTNIPKKQYHISTSTNKVYDISERKNFCSNQCLKASKHFCNQIPESPLWTRAKEAPADIKLLPHTEISGMVGNEVVGTLPQKLLEKEIKKLEELEIRSPSVKKERQPPEKKNIQTATLYKTVHATDKDVRNKHEEIVDSKLLKHNVNDFKDEKNEESLEESKSEELVDRNATKHSFTDFQEGKPTELEGTVECEASVNKDIISQNSNTDGQLEEVTIPNLKGHLKPKQDVSCVIYSSNVTVNLDCENVNKDRRFDHGNEQTTKIDYLMKLLSKRKNVLSGMIDDITVVSDGSSQPNGGILPSTENMNVISSAEATLEQTSDQPPPVKNLLQANGNQVDLNQNSSKNSSAKASHRNLKSSSKKKKLPKSPLERLGDVIKTWITPETTAYIHSSTGSNSENSMSFSDPRIQRGYANLCQRLDSQQKDFEDLIDGTEDVADKSGKSLKSTPDYAALKKESEEFQLKVMEFITGRKPETVQKEDSEDTDPVYIPTVDAFDQQQIRTKIVLDRLDKFLPDLLPPLRLSVQDVSSLVRELVYTFRFEKDNIIFKPSEWILVAIFILKMLGKKNKSIAASFAGDSAVRHFNILFKGIGATAADLDVVTEDILS